MQARIVTAAQGAGWLLAGWRLFRVAPFGWLAATLAYWFSLTVLSLVPAVGGAVAVILVPAFTVGFMALARAAERGGALDPRLLFDAFRQRPAAQLVLGVVYLAALAAVLALSALVDEGRLARWVLAGRGTSPPAEGEAMLGAAGVAALAYLPVMAAFWFSPPLVAWHSAGVAKALFFSFFACLMNWRAMLAYGALVAAATLALPLVLLNALALASGGETLLAAPLLAALIVVVLPILFASFYASYRDVFGYHSPP